MPFLVHRASGKPPGRVLRLLLPLLLATPLAFSQALPGTWPSDTGGFENKHNESSEQVINSGNADALGVKRVSQTLPGTWLSLGGGLDNNHNASSEQNINTRNVGSLGVKWVYQTTPDTGASTGSPLSNGDITVPPAVFEGILYFPDWAGNLQAVSAKDGTTVWKKSFASDYARPGKFMLFSRNTPAVTADRLIVGSEKHLLLPVCPQGAPSCVPNNGAVVAAVNRRTGNLLWSTLVSDHPAAKITSSPVIVGNQVIVGVSSWEEDMAAQSSALQFNGSPNDPYPCCSFRGSVVSLDLQTGSVQWQTYLTPGTSLPAGLLTPGDKGYSGVAVYGGSPSIDLLRHQIYVATANNYTVPKKAEQCERHRLDSTNPSPDLPGDITCANLNEKIGNYVDAVMALDLRTGRIKWAFHTRQYDAWTHACAAPDFNVSFFPPIIGTGPGFAQNCSSLPGPDYGFGQAPMIMWSVAMPGGGTRDLIGAGEKSGIFWTLDANTGRLVWSTRVGPGGILGGMQWGSASDGKSIYTAESNSVNASRNRNRPFYPSALNPIYPGYPGFINTQVAFSGPGFIDAGLPRGFWTLINPPEDVQPDQISTFNEPDGTIKTITGFWSALDAATGRILWQRPLPTNGRPAIDTFPVLRPSGGLIHGSVTVANGVLFGGGLDGQGSMYGMDATTGRMLFEFHAQFNSVNGGGVISSPAVVDGSLYWGAGASMGGLLNNPSYSGGIETRNNKMYAFSLPHTAPK